MLFHLNAETHVYALTRHAYVAVDFFFVLSGFVLMSGFDERVGDLDALHRFAARRLARLYPLHLATLLFLIALIGIGAWRNGEPLFTGSHGLPALIQCLTLVQGFTTDALSWNFPSWSISIELWASLLFGLVLWLAKAWAWVVLAFAATAFAAVVLVFGEPAGPATSAFGALLKAAHYLLAFCVGAVLFKIFAGVARRGWLAPRWIEWPALALVVSIFLFADRMASPLSIGLFAVAILVFAHERGPVSAWLRRAEPQALGQWSYSIYLVHPFWTLAAFGLASVAGAWLRRPASVIDASGARLMLGGPVVMDLVAIACLMAVIATAALTYRLIERPGLKLAARNPHSGTSRTPRLAATPNGSPCAERARNVGDLALQEGP